MERFRALTEGPIIFHYGDDILSEPTNLPAQDSWRALLEMARRPSFPRSCLDSHSNPLCHFSFRSHRPNLSDIECIFELCLGGLCRRR